jgi:regulator of sigma E protease
VIAAAAAWIVAVLAIPAAFLLLIAPHEGGHFVIAKLCRMRAFEFSIGMGTRLWSKTKGGTLYAIRLLPIGGYVRIGGMEPGDFDDPNGFHRKAAWQRLAVLFAGPVVNFVMAALLVLPVFLSDVNDTPGRVVAVTAPSPAYDAGIRPDDTIVSVDGRPATSLSSEVAAHQDQPLTLVIRHANGRSETVTVTPGYNEQLKRKVIGVTVHGTYTPGQAVLDSALFPVATTVGIGAGIYELASGQIPGGLLGPQGVTGAIGIGYVTYQAARAGWQQYLLLIATLSVALGLANLLPVPALDGGRILVVLLEKLRGRPFDREREMQVQRFGLVALLALIAFIAYFDIQRIATGQFPVLR